MCGRVRQSSDHSETKIRPDFGPGPKLFADGFEDAKPSEELQVWRRHPETGEPIAGKLRWGLIPHWMKARPEIRPINARAETISEKRMFSEAYAKRRCIVPMDAFYERDKRKKLHAFGLKDGKPFGVAGIWENWRNADGEWERTFCIITVPPNELVGAVHDRMPAIIPIEQHARWLGTELDPRDLLRPYPAEEMEELPLRGARRQGGRQRQEQGTAVDIAAQ
jgi:putative SOS response-associated peptidase YedK